MKLRNYTSTVHPAVSIDRIEVMLVEFGARSINKDYEGGKVTAFRFDLDLGQKNVVTFRLPSRVDRVFELLWKELAGRNRNKDRLRDQAERTAWKIAAEWVEIQLTMIRMGQAKPAEVFMSYLWDGRQTLFSALEANNFSGLKALAAPKEQGDV